MIAYLRTVAKKRYQAVGFPCNRMLKLSSSRGIRIDVPVLSVSWYFEDHSVIIQALTNGRIEHEASDTGGVPRWNSSCPGRLAEATDVNCNDTRLGWHKNLLLFRVHVEVGSSTHRSDRDYLSLQLYLTKKM